MKQSLIRTIIAGLVGGMMINIMMLLTFRLIGMGLDENGILLDPSVQSKKLIAVWTEIEPLPLVVSNPVPIIIGLIFFGIIHAFLYRWLSPGWPQGVLPRTLRFAGLIFLLSFLFWEFFTPFNQFGEPLRLVALELLFWALIAFVESLTIAGIMEKASR